MNVSPDLLDDDDSVVIAIAVAIASNMTFFVCDGRKELLVIFRENQLVNAQ